MTDIAFQYPTGGSLKLLVNPSPQVWPTADRIDGDLAGSALQCGQGSRTEADQGGRGRVGKVLIVHQRSTGRRVRAKQAKSERWFLSRLRTRQERCTLDFDGLAFAANGIGSALVCSSVSTHPLRATALRVHCSRGPVSTALRGRRCPSVPLVAHWSFSTTKRTALRRQSPHHEVPCPLVEVEVGLVFLFEPSPRHYIFCGFVR
ncbi:hypothetical protein B0T20DRAFT_196718 [Sordaria brevicollis]|uniref:Uncharacterized protein n=1 Tax=Sordaria brevicollis TaxID=83679 RepID=A0AAE0UCQ1_SORBR|nr:hypothetical protein B0T20DRAFT_196718 [Sordaria brevicollis]